MDRAECDHEYTLNGDGTMLWCQKCDSVKPAEDGYGWVQVH